MISKTKIISLFLVGLCSLASAAESPDQFTIEESGLAFHFSVIGGKLRQVSFLPTGMTESRSLPASDPATGVEVELETTGSNWNEHHGAKLIGGSPGTTLVYVGHETERNGLGRHDVLVQQDPGSGLRVESHYQFFDGVPMVRRWTKLINQGQAAIGIDHVSSAMTYNFANFGPSPLEDKVRIYYAHNSWKSEAQWHSASPAELGLYENTAFSMNAISFGNIGSWSTMSYLPVVAVQNRDVGVIWFAQIEHNGSWHWEMSNTPSRNTYLYLGGPDDLNSQAWKNLRPGESFVSVPVAIGCLKDGFEGAVAAFTSYRRTACLQPTADSAKCPVIFNDYMNCLRGDPTSEKEYPLIDAAAAAGCEYYVIDAGWYAELNQPWWDSVGPWQESKTRWGKGGLAEVLRRVKAKGMIPGLWLEIEVAGVNSTLKSRPDNWFFQRHGQRVIDHGRYFLDYRNPDVRQYADGVIERLIRDYGIGYIKMDYNVDALQGTDLDADSPGQGMLEHQRAYLRWIDSVHQRHPDLVIENCGSGGGRMDYAMLSHFQLQSSSDQTDYRKYPAIVAGGLAAVLPEQLGVWSYPLKGGGSDQASFNMVNAMLARIHQSGSLATLDEAESREVKTGIEIYKRSLRPFLTKAVPFLPLGFANMADPRSPVSVGLRGSDRSVIALWRLTGASKVTVPVATTAHVSLLYPSDLGIGLTVANGNATVTFPRPYMAAILDVNLAR